MAELHAITTGRQTLEEVAAIAARIHPYVAALHLREPSWSARELHRAIERLREAGVPPERIVVNDRADVAAVAEAGGVQLGYRSLDVRSVRRWFPQLRIGASVHTPEEARQAQEAGADYVVYGHIYATASKPGLPPRGVDQLRQVAASAGLPVVAIGGILPSHLPELLEAGASGVAVMSGIWEAEDPLSAARAYDRQISHQGGIRE